MSGVCASSTRSSTIMIANRFFFCFPIQFNFIWCLLLSISLSVSCWCAVSLNCVLKNVFNKMLVALTEAVCFRLNEEINEHESITHKIDLMVAVATPYEFISQFK